MFDNTLPNIILISDQPHPLHMMKNVGVAKVAHELRLAGFQVAVLQHLHIFSVDEIKHILTALISDKTLFLGTSPFFYQNIDGVARTTNGLHFKPKEFGAMLPHGKRLNSELKKFVKNLNPKIKLVIGGPDARDAEFNKDYDYIVQGFADVSAVNLANHLLKGDKLNNSKKSIWGPIVIDDSLAKNFDFPNSTLQYLDIDCILPNETLSIEIARGCIFNCDFCAHPLRGKKKLDYLKHEELLEKEFLDNYRNYGITNYLFTDDTFNDSEEKINMVWRISKRLPFELKYWAYIRLDLLGAKKQVTDRLFESGLRAAFFGIETFDKTAGSIIGKGSGREKQIETLNYIRNKWGKTVLLKGSFIFGLPSESIESMQQTIDYCLSEECALDSFGFQALQILPSNLVSLTATRWVSNIDLNPGKYGIRLLGTTANEINVEWESDTCSWKTALDLRNKAEAQCRLKENFRIDGREGFYLLGLGISLDTLINTPWKHLPWHEIDNLKMLKSKLYRKMVFETFKVDACLGTHDNVYLKD